MNVAHQCRYTRHSTLRWTRCSGLFGIFKDLIRKQRNVHPGRMTLAASESWPMSYHFVAKLRVNHFLGACLKHSSFFPGSLISKETESRSVPVSCRGVGQGCQLRVNAIIDTGPHGRREVNDKAELVWQV